ncbi:Heterotetrameric sarcosine oxidase gamma subunit [Paraburkholderia tropica]|uniref:sarcosine oxidase subunit gamma n=1 Tax=Paraburkholderia tropica TaxID=92647 RepID=UPI001CB13DC7|nr:sarcosine oxidase subunit gamma [Paraburkholderia tropica]CAG9212682.1 Heterotetrameric sarcosine oxidase gamma subunit [Paraburkholderia tropica]
MWNETRDPMPLAERAVSVNLESPFIGVDDLLKAQDARLSKAFVLREQPFRDLVNVRGELSDPAFVAAFERTVGCRPPAAPNTVARSANYDVLWLGPDEWLVRSSAPVRAGVLEAKLAPELGECYAAAVDVGSGYTVVEIEGTRVREVLSRGCPLDLHPSLFKPGQCAQSLYFKASIVLIPIAADRFELVIRRSFADYFCRIMLDAAASITP